ncbi:putative serine protease K12H4.7 [Cochliomyia hominivorax]
MLRRQPPINCVNCSKDYQEVKEQWLPQLVDHFDKNNSDKWMMRYFVNEKFYRNNSPIFVFLGGEWEITPEMLTGGHFYDMARQQEALMFYTEHRYYGESWPKSNLSPHNLRYLNVLQSLEDLKYFLTYQKASSKALKNSKVVLVGGSYSGSMVSWFMTLYPEMADAGWASSAPLVAKMDFNEYMTYTMFSIKEKGGLTCSHKLEEAFNSLAKAMQTNRALGLLKRLNICRTFDTSNPFDRQAFFNGLSNYFAAVVQSYSSFIPGFCARFLSLDARPLEALIEYLADLYAETEVFKIREPEEWCLDFSYEGLKALFKDENDLKAGARSWFYQTCHEFGWFSTTSEKSNHNFTSYQITLPSSSSTSTKLAFGGQVPLSYFQQLCQDVFGNLQYVAVDAEGGVVAIKNLGHGNQESTPFPPPSPPSSSSSLTLQQMHARALAINKVFGGLSNISKRVIFTHGLLDPWRAAGLQYGQNVLLIKDYSHVEDLGSINLSDTVEMNVVKLKVASFITRILRRN